MVVNSPVTVDAPGSSAFFLLYAAWVRSRAERPSVSYTTPGSSATAPSQPDVEMTGRDSGGVVHERGGSQQHEQTGLVNKQQRVEVKILKYQVVAHEMFQLFLQALLCA